MKDSSPCKPDYVPLNVKHKDTRIFGDMEKGRQSLLVGILGVFTNP